MSLLLHQIWINVALHHCLREWMLCSEWVPSEWESKQLIKTLQVIHTTPFYQLPYEVKSCVCKKNVIRVRRFHLNCCFWLKYEQKHLFLQWKQVLSCLIWEKIMHIFAPFTSKNSSKQIWVDFWSFSLKKVHGEIMESIHWWANDAMQNSQNLFWWRYKLIYIFNGLRVRNFSASELFL